VPRVSNAAAVNGDCADAATVVTASETAGDDAVADAVASDVAAVAAVAVVPAAADVAAGAGVVDADEDVDGDEFEQAAPARPSTARPPTRRNVRRSARSGR